MPAEITRIKICGLRGADAAVAASNAGADFLGFNFVEGVRRQLHPDQGAQIVAEYKRDRDDSNTPGLVGLFRNQNASWVNETSASAGLDYVQLCGDEDDDYIAQMQLPIFRQVRHGLAYLLNSAIPFGLCVLVHVEVVVIKTLKASFRSSAGTTPLTSASSAKAATPPSHG